MTTGLSVGIADVMFDLCEREICDDFQVASRDDERIGGGTESLQRNAAERLSA